MRSAIHKFVKTVFAFQLDWLKNKVSLSIENHIKFIKVLYLGYLTLGGKNEENN